MNRAKSKEIPLRWRTDFRIPETLPDIKVVRTNFVLNFGALVLLIAAAFFLAQREFNIRALQAAVGDLEGRIQSSDASNRQNIALNQRFVASARRFEELQQFYRNPFEPHRFLVDLAHVRPNDIVFRQISFQPVAPAGARGQAAATAASYRVDISGEVRELPILNQLKTILGEFSFAGDRFTPVISETVQPRTEDGNTPYALEVVINPKK